MNTPLLVYEWKLLWRDRWAALTLAGLAVLLLATLLANAGGLARDQADKARVAAAERARWLGQEAKDPHSAAHYSIYAFKPAPALALLDLGIEPYVGQAVWLEAHVQNDLLYRPQADATPLERSGLRHPASLLIAFAPLAAFVLALSGVARERERSTLRLALGAARDPRRLALGKYLAIWLALLLVLLLPLAVGALLCAPGWSGDTLLRLGSWVAAMAIYLAIAAAAAVAVALRARGLRTALAALFGAWAVFALALPRLASSVAEALQPLPPTQSVKQQLLDEAPAFWSAETSRANEAAILAKAGAASRDALGGNYRGLELDLAERHSHAVFDRVLGAFYDRVLAQDAAYRAQSWLSPAIAINQLSMALSGTDFAQHRPFVDAAEHYRRALVNRMNEQVAAHGPDASGKAHQGDAALWAAQPAFTYAPPRLQPAQLAALPALLAWLLVALAGLLLGARRYRA